MAQESNIGKMLNHYNCGGFFGKARNDLYEAVVEAEGDDWMLIRTTEGYVSSTQFTETQHRERFINMYLGGEDIQDEQ